jgi:cell division transport system permease protein
MIGALFVFFLVANAVTKHFREQLTVQVMLADDASEGDVLQLKKRIEGESYAGSVNYVSKEEAAQSMQEELGEEFVDFLGYNPLPASLDIKINPDFAQLDSLEGEIQKLQENTLIEEVVYQKGLLQQVNENIGKWGLGLLILGILFLLIAVVLIVNTIELAIFSQRFLIKSMQLVGATHWFIQKPFMKRGLWYGFISSIISLAILFLVLYYFRVEMKDVVDILMQESRFILLILGVIGSGLLVSWLATTYAVQRFIRLRQDQLH